MSKIAQAASVLLARGPGSAEVFLVRRSAALRFFGDFWAFPGGKVAQADAEVPVRPGQHTDTYPPDLTLRVVAVARELFEETGVLIARRADGSFPAGDDDLDPLRHASLNNSLSFAAILSRLGLTLHADDFRPVGGVTTPAFTTTRFDTLFFVAHLPPGQQAHVWPGELEVGQWLSAAAMLGRWTRGECLLSPPTVMTLQAIEHRPVDEAPARLGPLLQALDGGRIHPIYFAPQVQLIPLRSLALPPVTHTNAFLVGRDPAYLIDPGPTEPEEQRRLFEVLDEHLGAGLRLAGVVLTHHHPDHIGAALACVTRYGVPVWAHPWTAEKLRGRIEVTHTLDDGDRLDLGACPDGRGGWFLEAIHTPGHAPGHLAFHEPRYRLLLAGDMISTLTSMVIVPPEGDLTVYLHSLRRLVDYDCRLLLPAHGGASARPRELLEEALAHRARREEQLVAALGSGPRTVAALAEELYKGMPANLMRLAQAQVLAGLYKLQREGRTQAKDEQSWTLGKGERGASAP